MFFFVILLLLFNQRCCSLKEVLEKDDFKYLKIKHPTYSINYAINTINKIKQYYKLSKFEIHKTYWNELLEEKILEEILWKDAKIKSRKIDDITLEICEDIQPKNEKERTLLIRDIPQKKTTILQINWAGSYSFDKYEINELIDLLFQSICAYEKKSNILISLFYRYFHVFPFFGVMFITLVLLLFLFYVSI